MDRTCSSYFQRTKALVTLRTRFISAIEIRVFANGELNNAELQCSGSSYNAPNRFRQLRAIGGGRKSPAKTVHGRTKRGGEASLGLRIEMVRAVLLCLKWGNQRGCKKYELCVTSFKKKIFRINKLESTGPTKLYSRAVFKKTIGRSLFPQNFLRS